MTIDDLVFYDGSVRMGILGGDGVYSAIGASLWMDQVGLIAVAGPDYPVAKLQESFGIDVSTVLHKDKLSLRNWGLYERDGTRQFIFRNPTLQWAEYSPKPEDIGEKTFAGSHVHCAPMPWREQVELLRCARRSGAAFISVDPPFQSMDGLPLDELDESMNLVDVFLPSRQEIRSLFPGLNPQEALTALAVRYPRLKAIVIKLGEEGAIGYDGLSRERFALPAYPAKVVDPTGAGDSFCGGFLAGYEATGSAKEAVLRGTVSASFVVETEGTLGMVGVTKEMARLRLEEHVARIGAL
jgi:sugar/nucleoside kinase (ribokinase family)